MSDPIRSDFEPMVAGTAAAWAEGKLDALGVFADWCAEYDHPYEAGLRALRRLERLPYLIENVRLRVSFWGVHDGGGLAEVTRRQWVEWGRPRHSFMGEDVLTGVVTCVVPNQYALPGFWFRAAYDEEFLLPIDKWWMATHPDGILRIALDAYQQLPALQRAMYDLGHDENLMPNAAAYLDLARGLRVERCPHCGEGNSRGPRIRFDHPAEGTTRCRLCHNLGRVLARACDTCRGQTELLEPDEPSKLALKKPMPPGEKVMFRAVKFRRVPCRACNYRGWVVA